MKKQTIKQIIKQSIIKLKIKRLNKELRRFATDIKEMERVVYGEDWYKAVANE